MLTALLAENCGALTSYHESIRAEAVICLEQLTQVVIAQHGPHDPITKGVCVQLHPTVQELLKVALSTFINIMDGDPEKEPVARACESVAEVLQHVGIVALTIITDDKKRIIEPLMATITKLINEKAKCQTEDNYEQHEGDEDDDHDHIVMDSVCDLIGTLSKCMGTEFIPYFDAFLKPLLKFTKPNRLFSDRSMVIGCFAEVLGELGAASLKYADLILPVVQNGLRDEMEPVKRNSAFCVGVLIEATGSSLSNAVLPILQAIHPMCIRPAHQQGSDVGGADIDNAIAAVARIINAMPNNVPIAQILPVLLSSLPLRADLEEGPVVYGMICKLITMNNPLVLNTLLPQILTLFAEVLSASSKSIDETKQIVRTSIQQMVANADHANLFIAAVNKINDVNVKQILEQAVNNK